MLKIYVPKVLSGEIGDWCSSISLAAGVPICWGTDQLGHFVNAPQRGLGDVAVGRHCRCLRRVVAQPQLGKTSL